MNQDPYQECICDDCPRCKQAAGAKCVNPQTGKPSHVPCVARVSKRVSA